MIRASERAKPVSSTGTSSPRSPRSSSLAGRNAAERAFSECSASSTSSSPTPSSVAMSLIVGAAPFSDVTRSIVACTRTRSSCSERGTCTAHERSR